MTVNANDVMEDVSRVNQKLVKGYQTLQTIDEVDVAITPKTLVWQRDKVKLYHYDRATPAKCKVPVLVSLPL